MRLPPGTGLLTGRATIIVLPVIMQYLVGLINEHAVQATESQNAFLGRCSRLSLSIVPLKKAEMYEVTDSFAGQRTFLEVNNDWSKAKWG